VISARPDITAGLPRRELIQPYILQMVSGEEGSVSTVVRVDPGVAPTNYLGVHSRVTDEIILGLDVLLANDTSMDFWCPGL
jgi:hypothetical protein